MSDSQITVPTDSKGKGKRDNSSTPEGPQRMTRSQAADALAALSKSKPRKMRRKECAVKISAKSKKKATSSQPTPNRAPLLLKGKVNL